MSDTYTCADCGKTFPKGWSDEEAAVERDRDFPGMPDGEAVVVCDDCYRAMQERARSVGVPWAFDFLRAAIATVESREVGR